MFFSRSVVLVFIVCICYTSFQSYVFSIPALSNWTHSLEWVTIEKCHSNVCICRLLRECRFTDFVYWNCKLKLFILRKWKEIYLVIIEVLVWTFVKNTKWILARILEWMCLYSHYIYFRCSIWFLVSSEMETIEIVLSTNSPYLTHIWEHTHSRSCVRSLFYVAANNKLKN